MPVFTPKRRKNPTRWGGTYLYTLYKGAPPPNRRALFSLQSLLSARDRGGIYLPPVQGSRRSKRTKRKIKQRVCVQVQSP